MERGEKTYKKEKDKEKQEEFFRKILSTLMRGKKNRECE